MAATIVMGLDRLAMSFCKTRAGRVFWISAPSVGSKLTRWTAPRRGGCRTVRLRRAALRPERGAGRVRVGRAGRPRQPGPAEGGASLAAETLIEAFQHGRLDEAYLSRYEQRWRERLGPELRAATWFRRLMTRFGDPEIDAVVQMLAADDLQALIRRTGRFNWHRELIRAVVCQRTMARLLFSALLR